MIIQIKKADSVTSILLFLFNVFLGDQGIRELPVKNILTLLQPFAKSETSIRMGLSRGVRNGVLTNFKQQGEVCYGITSLAAESFKYWWKVISQFQAGIKRQHTPWDGQWTMIQVREDLEQDFSGQLKDLKFGNLHKASFVSPYDLTQEVLEIAKGSAAAKKLYIFRGTLANGYDPGEVVQQLWQIKKLNGEYKTFMADLDNASQNLSEANMERQELPLLHLYGMKLFEIIQHDPQLPLALLPANWSGIEAFLKFNQVREQYLPGALQFVNKVIRKC